VPQLNGQVIFNWTWLESSVAKNVKQILRNKKCANRNRKLKTSTAPTKAKSWEPAYSQALVQSKIDRQRVRSRESGRQTVRRYGEWYLEL